MPRVQLEFFFRYLLVRKYCSNHVLGQRDYKGDRLKYKTRSYNRTIQWSYRDRRTSLALPEQRAVHMRNAMVFHWFSQLYKPPVSVQIPLLSSRIPVLPYSKFPQQARLLVTFCPTSNSFIFWHILLKKSIHINSIMKVGLAQNHIHRRWMRWILKYQTCLFCLALEVVSFMRVSNTPWTYSETCLSIQENKQEDDKISYNPTQAERNETNEFETPIISNR